MNALSTKRVAIATLGCKVNQYDSHVLEESLREAHATIVSDHDVADIYIVNSCTVTGKADQEAKHLLRRFRRKNPKATLVITGCFAQTGYQELKQEEGIHFIIGNTFKTRIPELLANVPSSQTEVYIENPFKTEHPLQPLMTSPESAHRTRMFFKIQDGCDDFCTFCIIPYARGKSRSLEPEFIIGQIQNWVEAGVKEVVIAGVSLGSWGWDLTPRTNLAKLVRELEAQTSLLRLRISSLEPEDVSDELLDVLKDSKIFCPHFHLPIQSGNDVILKKMQRNYTTAYYENLISKITNNFKNVFIGTDVICGFPGETEELFQDTYNFLKKIPWSKLHVFPYSPRKGTPAAKFPGKLTRSNILDRSKKLRELSAVRYKEVLDYHVGKTHLCLAEESDKKDFHKGLSRNYLPIYFTSQNISVANTEIRLKVTSRIDANLFANRV